MTANLLAIAAFSAASGPCSLTVGTRCATSVSAGTLLPPAIPRSQAYLWTPEWQQWEMMADYHRMTGDYYEPGSADDLIRWLNADD